MEAFSALANILAAFLISSCGTPVVASMSVRS